MHDFIADWKRWSRTERVLAIVVTLLMVAVPLVLLAAGKALVTPTTIPGASSNPKRRSGLHGHAAHAVHRAVQVNSATPTRYTRSQS